MSDPTMDILFAETLCFEGWDKIIIVMDDETFDSFEDEAYANEMTPGEWFRKLNNIPAEKRVKVVPKSLFFGWEDDDE